MRRLLFAAVLGLWTLGLAAPASAQDDPTIGSTGPASGEFAQTDEACGFGDFTDGSYTATIGEDADGVYIEFTQGSTGDSGRFRSDGDGNISFETDGDEEYNDIRVDGNRLIAQYLYGTDCVQEWSATVEMPEGFIDFLVAASAAPEPQPEPAPEPEPEPEPEVEDPPSETEDPEADAAAEPDDGGAAAPTDAADGESTEVDGSSDDGGIDWESLTFLALLLLFLIALFLLYRRRQQRLYRADPGDFGEFIPVPPGGDESDDDDEPEATSSGPPGVIVDDGEGPSGSVPPPTGDCIPEREEFELAREAKDAAFAAGEQADRELAAAKDAHGRLEAATRNPLGEQPPQVEVDPNASESEQAQAARVHALQLAEWEAFEQEAADAAAALPEAKAALDKARADRAEAWEDFQRMRRRLEAARVALNNCDGSAGPPDDEDEPPAPEPGAEPEPDPTGGTTTGGGRPGVITDPPTIDPPPVDEDTCPEGAEKDGEVVSSQEFRVPGGPITVEVGTSAWARHGRTFNPEAFEELDTDLVEELSAGIEQERTAVRISVRIPTTIVTVQCVAILVCRSNAWIDSGRRKRVESRAPGPDLQVLPTGAAGGVARSKDRRDAGRMVEKAQALLAELRENEEDAAEVDCD
ncbi:MAG: hypothetical protein R8F63_01145 [Acidimicrobiales bacterium]|nr:hypothetical protein [Acidimicrobiales bacterium]